MFEEFEFDIRTQGYPVWQRGKGTLENPFIWQIC